MEEIRSPMAGSVWKVLVEVGAEVSTGETVAILESMKMEIPVEAEKGGTVDAIYLGEGSVVDEDEVIMVLK